MKALKIMKKTLKYLLIVAMISLTSVLSATNVVAQNLAQQPEAQMKSTSVMPSSGSTLPQAAIEGVTTTYSPSTPPSGPRRVGRDDNAGEPGFDEPIGDAPWAVIVLFGILYVIKRKYMKRKKSVLMLALLMMTLNVAAEGYETMANITKQTYEWTDVTNYTGDNGMSWKAVGAQDSKISGYKALALHSSVSGNGLSGNLTAQQTAQGVGTVSFMVKGAEAGTGYGNRSFRVTAGSKSVVVTVNVPSMSKSYQFDAKVDVTGASTLAITMLESVSGETASFYIYNVTWTSFSGKTDAPVFTCNDQFVANGADTTYYAPDHATVLLSCPMEGATIYYTTDGSTPTQTSTQGNSLTLGTGTHTVKAMAWTAAQGESDIATKVFKVGKAIIAQYDASNTDAAGEYSTTSASAFSTYKTLSGLPFYQLNLQKNHIITDAVVHPIGLSCYAKNTNSRTLTVAWQAGEIVMDGENEVFEPTTDWTDITTLSDFNSNNMKRFEILVPEAAKTQFVRFRLQASGTAVYVDDIIVLSESIDRAVAPTFSHASGELASGTQVTITPASGTTLHYIVNNAAEKTSTSAVNLTISEATEIEAYSTQTGKAQSATIRVQYTVAGVVPEPVHPTSVVLDKTELSIVEGQTDKLTATVLPAEAEDKSVTWSSNNEAVATVSQQGEIMALIPGEATITVTTVDGGLTATCALTVTKYIPPEPIHPSEVTLSRTSVTIQEGAIAKLTATVLPADAENKSVTWSTSDASIATVSDGTITGVKAGEATITVTTVDGGLTATCKVTVTKAPVYVTGVELNKTELVLEEGDNETLTATIIPSNADDKRVTWESDNEAAATVDENGFVSAVKKGEANISVITVDGEHIAQCHVYVIPKNPQGIDNAEENVPAQKILREGQIFILRNGEMYSVTGARVQ